MSPRQRRREYHAKRTPAAAIRQVSALLPPICVRAANLDELYQTELVNKRYWQ